MLCKAFFMLYVQQALLAASCARGLGLKFVVEHSSQQA